MTPIKSPGALAALGVSVVDQLGRQVFPETNRQQQFAQAPICAEFNDAIAARKFHQIQKFAARRRQ